LCQHFIHKVANSDCGQNPRVDVLKKQKRHKKSYGHFDHFLYISLQAPVPLRCSEARTLYPHLGEQIPGVKRGPPDIFASFLKTPLMID
jgi:hypothetical protein